MAELCIVARELSWATAELGDGLCGEIEAMTMELPSRFATSLSKLGVCKPNSLKDCEDINFSSIFAENFLTIFRHQMGAMTMELPSGLASSLSKLEGCKPKFLRDFGDIVE
jgi:hypothetical protein